MTAGYVPTGYEYDVSNLDLFTHEVVTSVCNGRSEEDLVHWCMAVGLLPSSMLCPSCAQPMTLAVKLMRWRCNRTKCRCALSVRSGSVFFNSRLPLRKAVLLLYYFASGLSLTATIQFTKVSKKAACEWFGICRDYCSQEMVDCDMVVGGRGHTVEIDETSLKKKSKYNRGKQYSDFWVFGGFDRTSKKWFAIVTHNNRTKPTLCAQIARYPSTRQ